MADTTVTVRQYSLVRPAQLVRSGSFVFPGGVSVTYGFRGVCFNGSQLVFCTTRSLANLQSAALVFVDPTTFTLRYFVKLALSAGFLDAMDVCWLGGERYLVMAAENGGGFPTGRRDFYVAWPTSGLTQRTAFGIAGGSTGCRSLDWDGATALVSDSVGFGERAHEIGLEGNLHRTVLLASAGAYGPGLALYRNSDMSPGERVLTKQDPSLFAVRQYQPYNRDSWTPTGLYNIGTADNPTEQGPIAMSPSHYWEFDSSN